MHAVQEINKRDKNAYHAGKLELIINFYNQAFKGVTLMIGNKQMKVCSCSAPFKIACILVVVSSVYVLGAGPQNVATISRALWPEPITSVQAFDKASRYEQLVFLQCLDKVDSNISDSSLIQLTGIKSVNISSVKAWSSLARSRIYHAFIAAKEGNVLGVCAATEIIDSATLMAKAQIVNEKMTPEFNVWYDSSVKFYTTYVYEQVRLACLFPKITSEILTFSEKEKNGFELSDKKFLLTFDDGPTSKNGLTDRVIQMCKNEHVTAVFFILGKSLRSRLAQSSADELTTLYSGMTIGSHGMDHFSHAKTVEWKKSVIDANTLLDSVFCKSSPGIHPFRPPYAQRKDSLAAFLETIHSECLLWNIDSQDWNQNISGKDATDRTITLMLLWRKGIVLFHDVHKKAEVSIPEINKFVKSAKLEWVDYK